MELLLVYLWLRLDTLSVVLGLCAAGAFVMLFVLLPAMTIEAPGRYTKCADGEMRCVPHTLWSWWPTRATMLVLFVSVPLLIAMPSSRDVAVLVAAHYGKQAIVSPEGHKLLELARKRANEWLDEQLRQR